MRTAPYGVPVARLICSTARALAAMSGSGL